MSEAIALAAAALRNAKFAVAVTGAGVSAESGIPTFRGEGGIWERYPPDEYASIAAYRRDPNKVWRFWRELADLVKGCAPNAGHNALAELERMGLLRAVITQNVDNLHQAAGNTRVIEFHGNARRLVCLECRKRMGIDVNNLGDLAPHCPICTGLMKPDVVMFGEDIPRHAMFEAHALSEKCDAMLVVGTSAQVYPAAQLPFTAKSNGAFIIECNTERTDFTDEITDAFVEGLSGETLPALVRAMAQG
ncbi:MAG: NAD-dependent deacylase [Candidatus Hydrogenedentes bacterium]|nr:NAD-dependent deacylase [Candidatus Hydrogenedentota bacterium]